MLKFRKNTGDDEDQEEIPAEDTRGVSGAGNSVFSAFLLTLLILLVPVLAASGYLIGLREPTQVERQLKVVSASFANQQATTIHHMLTSLRARLQGAASSPLALSAIAGQSSKDIALVEKALLDHFPEAASLRIIPLSAMGTALLEGGYQGLRNHIEIDLVRRTGQGESTQPEAYRFEQLWLTSLAELVTHPRIENRQAVIIVTVENHHLSALLAPLDASAGKYNLEQVFEGATGVRTDVIASSGSGDENQYANTVAIPGTRWQLRFTPSFQLADSLANEASSLYMSAAVMALAGVFALITLLLMFRRKLGGEVSKIISAAHTGAAVIVRIPELVPLAKQMRRPSQARSTAVHGVSQLPDSGHDSEAPKASPNAPRSEPANLLYQAHGILVEEEEVLELELDEAQEKGEAPPSTETLEQVEGPAGEREPAAEPAQVDEESVRDEAQKTVQEIQGSDNVQGFPEHIFRAYDIRGNAERELTDELVTRVGGAIGTTAGEMDQQTLVVACDGRNSSPRIKSALIQALLGSGRDVIDIGLVPTPLLYFATRHMNHSSGVMVTGSHNPADCNGLKIILNGHTIAAGGIQQLRERALEGNFSSGSGTLTREDVSAVYCEKVVADLAIAEPLKIVIDAGNGATAEIAPKLFEELGCEVIDLNCTVDGNFPNHPPDSSNEDNLRDLVGTVKAQGANFGVAFDGDGDRVAVVTGSGRIVRADLLMMLFARDVVTRNPGTDVVFDVKCSRHLTQVIAQHGGRPVLWKTGHSFMKEKMIETGALLGGEFSGHIFFGERWYGFDDGMYAAGRLAEIISMQGQSLDDLLEAFPATINTPEIQIPVEEQHKFQLMDKIISNAQFSSGRVNTMDGIRVDFPQGWGLLRASNTAPVLTARFEADTESEMERIKDEFRAQLSQAAPEMEINF